MVCLHVEEEERQGEDHHLEISTKTEKEKLSFSKSRQVLGGFLELGEGRSG